MSGQSVPRARFEIDGAPAEEGWSIRTAHADLEMFEITGQDVVGGRPFTAADYAGGERVALVNESFADSLFRGRSPVGRYVHDYAPDGNASSRRAQIVGVLADAVVGPVAGIPQIYFPLVEEEAYPLRMLVAVDGEPESFAPTLRALVADAEPGLLLDEVYSLDDLRRAEVVGQLIFVVILLFVALVAILLSTAGVYALMSFLVTRRTREIGIRQALGAKPGRVVTEVFRRALTQLGLGVAVGLALVVWAAFPRDFDPETVRIFVLAAGGVSFVLVAVGMLGCAVPLRRALRTHPRDALAAE